MFKALIASALGVGAVTGVSAMMIYRRIFARCDRPDYALTPGEFCYSRVRERLPREKFFYYVKGKRLRGYFYPVKSARGMVVFCHGMGSGADDYIPLIEEMTLGGFSVFAYDSTGTYDSSGKGTVGIFQQTEDLLMTLDYLAEEERFSRIPIYLLGHSWGGFAVTSALSLTSNILGVASISAMNSGTGIMLEKTREIIGKASVLASPIINLSQKIHYGNHIYLTSVDGINSAGIPTLIAHGVEDKVVPFATQSIVANRDKITNPHIDYLISKGLSGGHSNILYAKESVAYRMEIESEINLAKIKKGRELTLPEKAELFNKIDHRRYSMPNLDLTEKILETFG